MNWLKYIVDSDHFEVIKECEITCPNCSRFFTVCLCDEDADDRACCPDCGQGIRIVIEEEE